VLIVPIAGDTPGVLAVMRADIPGGIALPGGYCELGETWQQAGCREVREETGIHVNPDRIELFDVQSTPGTALLIFGNMTGPAMPFPATFTPTAANAETVGITVATPDTTLCFPLHNQALQHWFAHHT
jgi:ADP-ribose pyrophosphatase YjhB (NUDIX family)